MDETTAPDVIFELLVLVLARADPPKEILAPPEEILATRGRERNLNADLFPLAAAGLCSP